MDKPDTQAIVVVDIAIPFGKLVGLVIQIFIAAVLAVVIVVALFWLAVGFLVGML